MLKRSQKPARPDRKSELRLLLLGMISTTRTPDAMDIARLAPSDWRTIMRMARQHRLLPLLHQRSRDAGGSWKLPTEVEAACQAGYRASALRALSAASATLRIDSVLGSANIPYAALKGAFLAWHCWPDPALRPMRDVDILVQHEHAMVAYELLSEHGFCAVSPLDLGTDIGRIKHLPALVDATSGLYVEIHVALIDPVATSNDIRYQTFSQQAFARRQRVGDGRRLSFLTPEDTLLHIIVHAALDHRFNNGPLLLGDIAYLARAQAVDWGWFWRAARELGIESACLLTLTLADMFEGPLPLGWNLSHVANPPARIIRAASLMMLVDLKEAQVARFGASWVTGTWAKRLQIIEAALLPSRAVIATYHTKSRKPGSWLGRYGHRLLHLSKASMRAAWSHDVARETNQAADVVTWLQS